MFETILVVDDDKNLRDTYKAVLEVNNYKVITAETGIEALKIINEKMPDLIILDVKMPDITGTEVLAQIRESDASVPIIMSTGIASGKLKIYFDRWASLVISKPVNMEFLLAKVKELLGG